MILPHWLLALVSYSLLNFGKRKSMGDHLVEQGLCSANRAHHHTGVPLMIPVPASMHGQSLAVDVLSALMGPPQPGDAI